MEALSSREESLVQRQRGSMRRPRPRPDTTRPHPRARASTYNSPAPPEAATSGLWGPPRRRLRAAGGARGSSGGIRSGGAPQQPAPRAMAGSSSLEAVRRKIRSLQEQADSAEERAGSLQRELDLERKLRETVRTLQRSVHLAPVHRRARGGRGGEQEKVLEAAGSQRGSVPGGTISPR